MRTLKPSLSLLTLCFGLTFSGALLAGCGGEIDPSHAAASPATGDGDGDHGLGSAAPDAPASGGPAAPSDPPEDGQPTCRATASGDYCGGDEVDFGDAQVLYRCDGPGPATVVKLCAEGCTVAAPGVGDSCTDDGDTASGDVADTLPPTCTSTAKTGYYCGGDKVVNGSSRTLYHCSGPGHATVSRACANGCKVNPGEDDACASAPPPPATCTATAHTGNYCAGDKVANGHSGILYRCDGPGAARVAQSCSNGCRVAPAGRDDYCAPGGRPSGSCPHEPQLKWGLHPIASDRLRCIGITASEILQTIGSAAASAGTHAQDGTYEGYAYSAATDLSVSGRSEAQIHQLLGSLANMGFAAFYRNPGHDGWPSYEIRHIHAIYTGAHMKLSLREQVADWLNDKDGLVGHATYTFFQPTAAMKAIVRTLFNQYN